MACATPLVAGTDSPAETRRVVTIVFSDLMESTTLGERLDAEALRRVISLYYRAMRTAIEAHGGTVAKFIGDAVMGAFGVRTVHEDDALRAVRAADEMRSALRRLNVELDGRWGVVLHARIGVNTGEVVTGDPTLGEEFLVGDAVNVAARLEQAAPPGEILIGPLTERLTRNAVTLEPVDSLPLKGKTEPVRAFRLLNLAALEQAGSRLGVPLIGRVVELDRLTACFDRTIDQRTPSLATVTGAAGVGKSRLVSEFVQVASDRADVFRGRVLSYGQGITFWPLAEVLRSAVGLAGNEAPDEVIGAVTSLLSERDDAAALAVHLGVALGFADGETTPEATFVAVRGLVESLARRRPTVVIFDDIQWAEDTFLDLVLYLARSIRDAAVMVVCTGRPELLERRPGWAGDVAGAEGIQLGPLDDSASEILLKEVLGAEPSEALARQVASHAMGNPLFLQETVRMLVDEGHIRMDGGVWQAAGLAGVAIPPTIQAVLSARLDRIPPAERAVLERAAVIGKGFSEDAVTELSPQTERREVPARLRALVAKELISPGSHGLGAGFTFGHQMVRDVAYAGLLKATRAGLHERFAGWLERAADRSVEFEEIIGYHLEQAYRHRESLGEVRDRDRPLAERAAIHLSSSGRRAHGRGDMPAAVKLLTRAISLDPSMATERVELRLDLGHALFETGESVRAREMYREAEHGAAHIGDNRLELRARLARSDLDTWIDPDPDLEELRRISEKAIPILEQLGDDAGLAKAWRNLATFHCFGSRWGQAADLLERALGHARRAGDHQIEAEMLTGLATALCVGPAPVDDAIERLEAVLRRVGGDEEAGSALATLGTRAAVSAWGIAGLEAMRGDLRKARLICDQVHRTFQELGQKRRLIDLHEIRGWIELLAGAPADAERELRASYEGLKEMGETAVLSTVAAELAEALHVQGNDAEAEALAEESRTLAAADDVESQVRWRVVQASLARTTDLPEAERIAREAVDIARIGEFPNLSGQAFVSLAEVLGAAGKAEAALDSASKALALYSGKGNIVAAGRTRKLIDALEGESGRPAASMPVSG
jgi:class 3 adenylate cyclase/tetratricopeptide (TPR) repeat protein